VMQKPLTIQDYLNAPYIAEPLRLNDYCLINDGGVAIIVRRADLARDLKQRPVMVSGFGWSEENVDATQLRPRLKTFYHGAHRDVAAQVYPMAGVTPKDVDVFATYDSFSVHLLASLEGFGFCREGEAGTFVQGGRIEIGGELPCNTSGGMLSESYMQSWNHQPELRPLPVRRLRVVPAQRQGEGALVDDVPPRLLPGVSAAPHRRRARAGRRPALHLLSRRRRAQRPPRRHDAGAPLDRRHRQIRRVQPPRLRPVRRQKLRR